MGLNATISCLRTDVFHAAGDSISNDGFIATGGWTLQPNGLYQQIIANWKPASSGSVTVSGSGTTTVSGSGVTSVKTASPLLMSPTTAGLIGGFAADIDAGFTTYIGSFNPTFLVLLIGINDADHGTAPSAFLTSYNSILAKCFALNPAMKVLCVSLFANGELWQPVGSGGPWGLNPVDAAIASLNTQIVSAATAASCACAVADIRTAFGTWLTTHNGSTPGVSFGLATFDGIHPNALGTGIMGQFAIPSVAVGP